MSVKTNKLNSANALISGAIAHEILEQKIKSVVDKIRKSIKLDGFRKGKVPESLIKARYKEQIDQDSKQEAVQDLIQAGLKDLGIDVKKMLGNPIITKFESKDNGIDVEVKISTTPDFSVDIVDSLVPDVKIKAATKAQIDERIAEIAKNRAPSVEITESRGIKKDDVANIDFEGFVDGKAFDGGKAENFNLTIGSGQFIPGFEDSLIGAKKGEQKTIKVKFPDNYQAAHLAGKDAEFDVKINSISEKQLPKIDDEFAKSVMGETGTLESLKDAVKEQLEMEQKTELYNKELKSKLLESIVEKVVFDLPEIIIEQEMDILFRQALQSLPFTEFDELKNDEKKAKAKRDSFRDEATKSVQVTFVMDALARKNNIVISDNEVMQTLYYEAMMMGQNPKDVLAYYQQNNLIPAIKMAMVEDRVLNFLLDSKLDKSKASKADKSADSKKSESAESKTSESAAKKPRAKKADSEK